MLLKLEGFTVESAAVSRAGLQVAIGNPPDLILSDVHMPHMNGYQLLAAVRDHAALRATRFVLRTREVDQAARRRQLAGDGRRLPGQAFHAQATAAGAA